MAVIVVLCNYKHCTYRPPTIIFFLLQPCLSVEEMEEEDAGPGDGDTGHRQSGPVICPPPGQLVTLNTLTHTLHSSGTKTFEYFILRGVNGCIFKFIKP